MSKQKQVIARLRKCGQVDRYIIRHYHKGPVAVREHAKRKYPWLFYIDEKPIPQPLNGITVSFSMSKQMTQPLPETIDMAAWSTEFDKMALCEPFGVPYEDLFG